LAKALKEYTNDIKLVSRNPVKVNQTDELLSVDLLDSAQVMKAVKGSSIVYVTVGFPYSYKTWKESWPGFIQNVLDASLENKNKLVFFDNIYMYDPAYLNGMTEETPVNPPSKKGKVRAGIVEMIMKQVEGGKLETLIARSADFYGPGIKNTSTLILIPPMQERQQHCLGIPVPHMGRSGICPLQKIHLLERNG
jgi:nucleoside-diphosphate-sugar epimerase